MAHSISLGYASTIINLNQQTATWTYRLMDDSWSPGTAERTWGTLATAPFGDVEESFDLMIQGSTSAAVMTAYKALVLRFDAARVDTRMGYQSLTPTTFVVTLDGASNEYSGLVVVQEDDPPCVAFSSGFLTNQNQKLQRNVRLRFRHRMFVNSSAAKDGTTTTFVCGVPFALPFAAASDLPSPTTLAIGQWSGFSDTTRPSRGAILIGRSILAFEVQGLTMVDTFDFTDTAKAASNTTVLRFNPTVLTKRTALQQSQTLLQRCLVFAEVRNNTAGKEYGISLDFIGGGYTTSTRTAVIKAGTTNCTLVSFGLIQCPILPTAYVLNIQAAALGGTLDIDRIILVEYTPETHVIAFGRINVLIIDQMQIYLEPSWTWGETTLQYRKVTDFTVPLAFSAISALVAPFTFSQTISVCFLAYTVEGGWAFHTSGTRLTGLSATATRQAAALLPW